METNLVYIYRSKLLKYFEIPNLNRERETEQEKERETENLGELICKY